MRTKTQCMIYILLLFTIHEDTDSQIMLNGGETSCYPRGEQLGVLVKNVVLTETARALNGGELSPRGRRCLGLPILTASFWGLPIRTASYRL